MSQEASLFPNYEPIADPNAYAPDLYQADDGRRLRFLLGKSGDRMLVAVGLNPSTADLDKADMTIRKLMGFAERNGYDGWAIVNLYPLRETIPEDLPDNMDENVHRRNLEIIREQLKNTGEVRLLAAWGSIIAVRPYLLNCLADFSKLPFVTAHGMLQIGSPTAQGHPRHPSRAAYAQGLQPFELESYLEKLKPATSHP